MAATRVPTIDVEARLLVIPFLVVYTIVTVAYMGLTHSDVLLLWPAFFVTVRRATTAEFGMESFVPPAAQPAVKAVFERTCRYLPPAQTSASATSAESADRLPQISNDSVAERRRARALKALDRKLAEMEAEPDVPLDEEAGKS